MSDMRTIDLTPTWVTPTWGEWANIYRRFAESGETIALKHLAPDLARMAASCEALKQISSTLTDAQNKVVADTMVTELTKQGF